MMFWNQARAFFRPEESSLFWYSFSLASKALNCDALQEFQFDDKPL